MRIGLARPEGFEPPTYGFVVRYSSRQLLYFKTQRRAGNDLVTIAARQEALSRALPVRKESPNDPRDRRGTGGQSERSVSAGSFGVSRDSDPDVLCAPRHPGVRGMGASWRNATHIALAGVEDVGTRYCLLGRAGKEKWTRQQAREAVRVLKGGGAVVSRQHGERANGNYRAVC